MKLLPAFCVDFHRVSTYENAAVYRLFFLTGASNLVLQN
jgi:hypothetical protein